MYSEQELIDNQKQYSKWHIVLTVFLVIVIVVNLVQNFSEEISIYKSGIALCLVFLVEAVFSYNNFFRSVRCAFVLRYFQIVMISVINVFCECEYYEIAVLVLTYILISIEFSNFFDIEDAIKRLSHAVLCTFPMLLASFVNFLFNRDEIFLIRYIFDILFEGTVLYCITSALGTKISKYFKAMLSKERMLDKALDINNDIIEKQQKLFYVNEQLGIKRVELEAANKLIRLNSMEMDVQRELLEYFTSSFNMDDINDFFKETMMKRFNMNYVYIRKCIGNSHGQLYPDSNIELRNDIENLILTPEFIKNNLQKKVYIHEHIDYVDFPIFENYNIRSFCAKAIYIDGKIAYIYLLCHMHGDFFENKETYFENIFHGLSVAINNAALYKKYFEMSIRDGLTELYNRRHLNENISLWNTENQSAVNRTAVLYDIDNFKHINDTYGHLCGDTVIRTVARIIDDNAIRVGGMTYRYGGEEFITIFDNVSLDVVKDVVEKTHDKIRDTLITDNGVSFKVNSSVGISSYPETCDNIMDIIERADKAMYYSKTHGKGRITIDGQEDS